jgi:hypothetical protein
MKNHKLFFLLIVIFSVDSFFQQIVSQTFKPTNLTQVSKLSKSLADSQITKYVLEPTGLIDVYGFGRDAYEYGEYAIIGAPRTHSNGIYNQGAAMVYKKVTEWNLVQMIIPNDSIVGLGFGNQVAMNDEFILATCPDNNYYRSLYIFKLSSSNIWEQYQVLTNAPGSPRSIDISGDYAIIGSEYYGEAYMFHYNGTNWERQQILVQDFGLSIEMSVSIDGDYAVVGSWRYNYGTGAVLVFRLVGQVWQMQDTLIASDAHFDDRFGYSVSIDGDYIAVGANEHNDGIGAAYIFKRDGSNWVEEEIIVDGQIPAGFGTSVSIKADYLVISASVYSGPICYLNIYNKVLNDWVLVYHDEQSGVYGYQTAISNNFILSAYHWVAQYNEVNIYEGFSISDVDENDQLPNEFKLSNNYPNPFNPATKIKYTIPELNYVTLKVYDVLGNEIGTLVNNEKPAGIYEVEFNGIDLPSGIYFYRLQAGNYFDTKKMVLLK